MPTDDELNLSAAPPAPPSEAAETESRGRGRPTLAEIRAREEALAAREAEIAAREQELALQAAEANLEMREREIALREQQVAAGRGSARSGTIRSDEVTSPVRGRRYKGAEMPNKYHIPVEDIPQGTSYQWNNYTVFGQEQHAYSAFMQMQGWEPVPASRHPHLVPKDTPPNAPIIIDGQMLVERPQELTDEALTEEYNKAQAEVFLKEQQLGKAPPGQFQRERANGSNEFNQVKRQVEPGAPVPRNYQYEGGGAVIE